MYTPTNINFEATAKYKAITILTTVFTSIDKHSLQFFHFKKRSCYILTCSNLPAAQRKLAFFFFPALVTFTTAQSRSSLGLNTSLCKLCLIAAIVINKGREISNLFSRHSHCGCCPPFLLSP